MKFRRTFRFHGLKRPRIRQTWNKYNLFNLHQNLRMPRLIQKTFFQQKWDAKALTRGYHGEHIKERQWERMFSRRLASVVDMNPRYMAEFDGSEQAEGRGSGKQRDPAAGSPPMQPWAGTNLRTAQPTPFMQMAFAPLERRLDIAIFRSLFASSARQARQFVVHGAVKVNGKKMIYPGYLLNPGDMFQVDVERVLYATGAKKPTRRAEVRAREAREAEESEEAEEAKPEEAAAEAEAANSRATRELPYLAARAKQMLSTGADDLTVKRKKALRKFVKDARKWIAKATPKSAVGNDAAVAALEPPPSSAILDRLADLLANTSVADNSDAAWKSEDAAKKQGKGGKPQLSDEERRRFQQLIARDAENPVDPSKPYATPWRPRPFMAPFAFIPRYLEVNQNICAAVYLRHPVARPGLGEVPTPFPYEINQLAFNWYLRRH